MSDQDRLKRMLSDAIGDAGRQLEEAKEVYRNARAASKLPQDDSGRVRIVCRRHAERRAVVLDAKSRPDCYDSDHRDCRGCLEDIRAECIETW